MANDAGARRVPRSCGAGRGRGVFAPVSWPCPGCGQQVTDRAYTGRPVHIEHGHAPGCARLAGDQGAEDQARRDRVPSLIVASEDPAGLVQRHWLAERIEDDCPRCGWHGYFHHWITTIGADWPGAVCDDCDGRFILPSCNHVSGCSGSVRGCAGQARVRGAGDASMAGGTDIPRLPQRRWRGLVRRAAGLRCPDCSIRRWQPAWTGWFQGMQNRPAEPRRAVSCPVWIQW